MATKYSDIIVLSGYLPHSTPPSSIHLYYTGNTHFSFSFLGHGDSYASLANRFRLGTSTIHSIIPDTCNAVYEVLQLIVLQGSDNAAWQRIERILEKIGLPKLLWQYRWETCDDTESPQQWKHVLQLQRLFFTGVDGLGGPPVQVHIHWCWGVW